MLDGLDNEPDSNGTPLGYDKNDPSSPSSRKIVGAQ